MDDKELAPLDNFRDFKFCLIKFKDYLINSEPLEDQLESLKPWVLIPKLKKKYRNFIAVAKEKGKCDSSFEEGREF